MARLSMERDEERPMRSENPGAVVSGALPRLEPLRSVRTDALEVAYFEAGPSDAEVEHLLHGSPPGRGGPSCHHPLSPRTWTNPLPGQHRPALGTASSYWHRCGRPDGRARDPARHLRRL